MSDSSDWGETAASNTLSALKSTTGALAGSATTFAKVLTQAFAASVISGKQLDDVLKSLALKMSDLALKAALKPVDGALGGVLQTLLSSFSGNGQRAQGAITPFAAGGVIGAPSYFPMLGGGTGLAGEAGPEAIMPLQRGPDGRLGVAGGGNTTIHVQIATPDPDSFRRSESYVTGQIARAVARGQRSL